jgi:type IV secretion system protein TrbL
MLSLALVQPPPQDPPSTASAGDDCAWWNLVCQGGQQVADSSLNALTASMVNGLASLFGQITKVVDESTQVPVADPTYRDTYYGFVGLAVPLIALVYFLALLSAGLRRDPRALTRATVGIGVAGIGGVVYVIFAQLLIALDDWLAHGIVAVTGADFHAQMTEMAMKFEQMGGVVGGLAADFLMLILMLFALVAGVVLWIVLLLRKMAILVVVALAPLLIAGWLWTPTRSWSRKATEVLVALVFCKSVIYVIFGIGMSLLLRDSQSLSDFVGVVVLLTGACFAPLVTTGPRPDPASPNSPTRNTASFNLLSKLRRRTPGLLDHAVVLLLPDEPTPRSLSSDRRHPG